MTQLSFIFYLVHLVACSSYFDRELVHTKYEMFNDYTNYFMIITDCIQIIRILPDIIIFRLTL
jgi:hypothetical protein